MKTLQIILLLAAIDAFAAQTLYKIVPNSPGTEVSFESDAPMETVVGRTGTVTGFIELDPATDLENSRAEIHVDMASLKTGITLRDKHMRENHLETSKYPEAVFLLSGLRLKEGASLSADVSMRVEVTGTLELHGVSRTITPAASVLLGEDGRSLEIEASFVVALADYNITRPEFLIMRLSAEQRITVKLRAVQEPLTGDKPATLSDKQQTTQSAP